MSPRGDSVVVWIRRLWEVEVIRFGLVGMANTLIAYSLFAALQLTLGTILHYTIVQAFSNVIATVQAYCFQRWFVFRHHGGWWAGLARFAVVYAGAFIFSLAMVALLVEVFGANVLAAGAVTLVIQALGTYLANRWFTFRRNVGAAQPPTSGDTQERTTTPSR